MKQIELEILECLASDYTYNQITAELNITYVTLNNYLKNIRKRFDLPKVNNQQDYYLLCEKARAHFKMTPIYIPLL